MNPGGPSRASYHLLVAAPNWLGDLVMSTSLLSALASLPHDGPRRAPWISLCVRRRWLPLLEEDPRVGRLLAYERTGRHARPAGLVRLAGDWREVRADAVILLPPSLRVGLASWLARIPLRVGYAADARGPLLTHAVKAQPRGREHYCEEILRLGRVWAEAAAVPDLAWPGTAPAPSLPGLAGLAPATECGDGPPLWIIAPGATYGTAKTWPPARVAELVDLVVGDLGARAVLIGDEEARAGSAEVRRQSRVAWRDEPAGPAAAVDLTGRTELRRVAALLKGSDAFVGNDSGLMHLAAALGVPTVGLFGSSNPDWTGPRGPRAVALAAEGFACRPCYRRTCNQPRFCLDDIGAARVLETALALRAGGEEATAR